MTVDDLKKSVSEEEFTNESDDSSSMINQNLETKFRRRSRSFNHFQKKPPNQFSSNKAMRFIFGKSRSHLENLESYLDINKEDDSSSSARGISYFIFFHFF